MELYMQPNSARPRILTPEELAVLIRIFREAKGWSQEQLADISKLSTRTIQRVEEGQPSSLDTRRALANALSFEDIDAFNKPYIIPTPEEVTEQKKRFDDEHLTLKAESIKTGRQLGRLMERASAHMFHESVDLPPEAAQAYARLIDFCKDYSDCDELYSAVDKLAIYEDLEQVVTELASLGFVLMTAIRQTQLFTKGSKDGVPVTVVYVVIFPSGQEPEQLLVMKRLQFE
jgi:transcriptional regulator with XRE-family HTH domain